MKKLIVAILMSLSVAAFAEEFSWADFEVLVEKAYGKSVYEVYGDEAYAACEYEGDWTHSRLKRITINLGGTEDGAS